MSSIIFENWHKIERVFLMAVLAYAALVFLLRVSGKRTLAKMNVFDFVFVVALGSALSTTILSPDVTLAEGVVAVMALIALQVLLSWLCVRSHPLDKLINGEPTLVFYRGEFLRNRMQKERVTEEELRAAIRNRGLGDLDSANSVVLETDGTFSVISHAGSSSSLRDVTGHPDFDPRRSRAPE
jgi:uncharacterized membrane protein YcaP (DUF421 family)